MEKKNLVDLLRENGIVEYRSPDGRLSQTGEPHFNLIKVMGDPYVRASLRDALWNEMDNKPTCVVGKGYGGILLATTLAEKYSLHLAFFRYQEKKVVIGGYKPGEGDRVIVVGDVIQNGERFQRIVKFLKRRTHAEILSCCAVINRIECEKSLTTGLQYLVTSNEIIDKASVRQ